MSCSPRDRVPQPHKQNGLREDTVWVSVLTIVAVVVLYFNLTGDRTLSSHEGYAVIPAQEMLISEDWLVPRFADLPRLEKPPLAYWVIAGCSALQGHVSVFTARLPATLAALGIALLMGHWAAMWYGRGAGYCAVLIQLTSVYQLMYCRKAEVDMLLLLLIVGALYLVANQPEDEPTRKTFLRWIGIYSLISLSWLAKFHYGPAMILAPSVMFLLVQKRWRSLWHLLNPVGLTFLAAAMFIWPMLVLQRLPNAWQIWQSETLGRAVGTLGSDSQFYYLPFLVWLPLPWTFHAALAIPGSWKRAFQQHNRRDLFLWIWLTVPFLILQLSASKHKHYLNALLPVFTLWAAPVLANALQRLQRDELKMNRLMALGFAAGVAALAIAATAVVWHKWPQLMLQAFAIGIMIVSIGVTSIALFYYNKPISGSLTTLGLCLALYMMVFGWLVPAHDYRMANSRFSQTVRESLGYQQTIYTYGVNREPFIYYLGAPVRRTDSITQFQQQLSQQGSLHAVVFADALPELRHIGKVTVLQQMEVLPHEAEPRHPPLVSLQIEQQSQFTPDRLVRNNSTQVQ